MRILFSRLLIYVRRVCYIIVCARVLGRVAVGKELHTLLVKSAIYVNLGTYRHLPIYLIYQMCGERRAHADKRMETTENRLAATLCTYTYNIREHKSLMFKLFAIPRYKKRIKQKSIIEIP